MPRVPKGVCAGASRTSGSISDVQPEDPNAFQVSRCSAFCVDLSLVAQIERDAATQDMSFETHHGQDKELPPDRSQLGGVVTPVASMNNVYPEMPEFRYVSHGVSRELSRAFCCRLSFFSFPCFKARINREWVVKMITPHTVPQDGSDLVSYQNETCSP